MVKANLKEIIWLPDVEDNDYAAAESYLSILYNQEHVAEMLARFKNTPVEQYQALDIFRASQLSSLGISKSHVEKDRKKIRKGKGLSPLLLVRNEQNDKVVIADGYHRLCAIYGFNEDALVPCKII